MTTDPQTWHYGLVARWWAEFKTDAEELPYIREFIERHGEPVLDVACGTGRLLLPLLRAGLDVDGSDVSPDMLALCRERVEREGFSPNLYAQAMHELDLPRRYGTIFSCGSFGIGGDRQHDLETLERLYRHLEPGGVLVVDHGMGSFFPEDMRGRLPEEWHLTGRQCTSDGSEIALYRRTVEEDPLEHSRTSELRAELWRSGKLVAEEVHTLKQHLYFKNEMLLMLERAGFRDVEVQGDYTEEEATSEHHELVFVARKREDTPGS